MRVTARRTKSHVIDSFTGWTWQLNAATAFAIIRSTSSSSTFNHLRSVTALYCRKFLESRCETKPKQIMTANVKHGWSLSHVLCKNLYMIYFFDRALPLSLLVEYEWCSGSWAKEVVCRSKTRLNCLFGPESQDSFREGGVFNLIIVEARGLRHARETWLTRYVILVWYNVDGVASCSV